MTFGVLLSGQDGTNGVVDTPNVALGSILLEYKKGVKSRLFIKSSILPSSEDPNQQQPTMQLAKSIMILSAIIFQCATAQCATSLKASACKVICQKFRGRRHCWNPCFTPGEYEYTTIQCFLNNPCTDQARYWRKFYKNYGMAVPDYQQCFPTQSRSERSPDCITAADIKTFEPMARCIVIKHDALCLNAIDFMTSHEIDQLQRDAQLGC